MGLPSNTNALQNGFAQGYQIGRSLRFRSSASAYLSRTPASASGQTTWTLSFWLKRGAIASSTQNMILTASGGSPALTQFFIDSASNSDRITLWEKNSGNTNFTNLQWPMSARDPSAWYHILLVYDTTQATSSNRVLLYVNGVLQSNPTLQGGGAAIYPGLNQTSNVNSNVAHAIGYQVTGSTYLDAYLTEINFVSGQALTPSSFGLYDSNGIWQPKKYTGTYGTNGFYLPFRNTTSTTTLVADASGNGNNWTPNNISLTAGATYDSMIDSPTNSNVGGNYCVLNPLYSAGGGTFSNGNLQVATGTSTAGRTIATMGVSSGKWYWEITPTSIPANVVSIGIVPTPTTNDSGTVGNNASEYGYLSDGQKFSGGAAGAFGASYVANDVIGVALDLDLGTIIFYKNGVSQGTAYSSIPLTNTYIPAVSDSSSANSATFVANFGQRPFSYSAPSGYNSVNTANLPQPLISNGANYMAATLYTGTGSNITITNSQSNGGNNAANRTFYPDFVWTKGRSAATNNIQIDSVRGGANYLISDSTSAEVNNAAAAIQSFSSTGYVMGTGGAVNTNGATYVAWQWLAGAGTTSTNTSGSITSTVSVSAQSGFSIATYTGTGAVATVGHGLGVAPNMIIWKNRSAVENWVVYHSSLGATGNVYLNLTNGFSTDSTTQNNTSPTSSVFTVATSGAVNGSAKNIVAYCFAAVRGYSAMGRYTGNGSSDGPFVFTNMRPRWLMIKRTDTVESWSIVDTSRSAYNQMDASLFPNLSNAEGAGNNVCDFLSNGFKLRNAWAGSNASGGTYVYMAFAENPFSIARAR